MVVYKGIVIILSWCFAMIWVSKHLSVCIFYQWHYYTITFMYFRYHIISYHQTKQLFRKIFTFC